MAAACLSLLGAQAQDHGHLNIGAAGHAQGSKLTWANGADFVDTSGYVKTFLTPVNVKYIGFLDGNITLTALHHTNALGVVDITAPAPGSFIIGQIVSVTGPEGGAFGFWDTNSTAGNPSLTIPVGTTPADAKFTVSDGALGAGQPGGDPFGHIHGRRLTVTKPGIYKVGFRAIDISTNGEGGGPIHTPSDVIYVSFQGLYNIKDIAWAAGQSSVTVGTLIGSTFELQYKTGAAGTEWFPVGQADGNDHFQTITDETAADPSRIYRVEVILNR